MSKKKYWLDLKIVFGPGFAPVGSNGQADEHGFFATLTAGVTEDAEYFPN